jgi:phenylacetate-coenzyme A ligase PaaK-like adenylate-forming protein
MSFIKRFKKELLTTTSENFEERALEAFHFQAENNDIYKKYLSVLSINPKNVKRLEKIPFLPIEFFKFHQVRSTKDPIEVIFESSGTTGQERSKHLVADLSFYLNVTEQIFESYYGKMKDYVFLALLPSYLERDGSSLVVMANNFIKKSNSRHSGFYLYDLQNLVLKIKELKESGQKIFLIGVTFALLDLAEKNELDLTDCIVMETGGMKGRRKEMIREELHDFLQIRFNVSKIHSEYGMTELLSQAYSNGNGIFSAPQWMKILIRDIYDPFDLAPKKTAGGINVIDLANIESCCFIETKDIGRVGEDGSFVVLGRFDAADIRGCNLLIG